MTALSSDLPTPRPSLLAAFRALGFAWSVTIAVLAVDLSWIIAAGWSARWTDLASTALLAGAVSVPLLFARYRHHPVLSTTLSTTALLLVFTMAAATLSYLVVSTNLPLVDAALDRADRAIGFDWSAAHELVSRNPWVAASLAVGYGSGTVQIAVVVVLLGLIGRPERIDEFARLFVAACVVAIVLSAPFPAAGAHKFYGVGGSSLELPALSHFEPLRDGRMRVIPIGEMQGLISIPSMHAATAVLLIWSMRGTWLFAGFALLNSLMLAATPVFGSHYLVDVVAGITLAALLMAIDRFVGSMARRTQESPAAWTTQRLVSSVSVALDANAAPPTR